MVLSVLFMRRYEIIRESQSRFSTINHFTSKKVDECTKPFPTRISQRISDAILRHSGHIVARCVFRVALHGAGVGYFWRRYGKRVWTCAIGLHRTLFCGAGPQGEITPAPGKGTTCANGVEVGGFLGVAPQCMKCHNRKTAAVAAVL